MEVSGVSSWCRPWVDELSSSESWASEHCVTVRPPRLFLVENAPHLNLALYCGRGSMEKKPQLTLIKAEHLQSTQSRTDGTENHPSAREGSGLPTFTLNGAFGRR